MVSDFTKTFILAQMEAVPKRQRFAALDRTDDLLLSWADRTRYDHKRKPSAMALEAAMGVLETFPHETRAILTGPLEELIKEQSKQIDAADRDVLADAILEVAATFHDVFALLGS